MFTALPPEDVLEPFHGGLPSDLCDGVGQRNFLRADLDAVLRVAALGDAARLHEDLEALVLVQRARRVRVEEERLTDRRGTDEVVVALDLRAHLEATAARDALIQAVHELLHLGRDAGPGAEVVRAVDRDPSLDALQR